MKTAYTVLFLCTGNSCRSILAEASLTLPLDALRQDRAAFKAALDQIGTFAHPITTRDSANG